MSDTCPVLTDKDIELMSRFRDEISEIQSSEIILINALQECKNSESELTGGGMKDQIIDGLVRVILFSMTALAAGASTAYLLTVIPEMWQMQIISIVNFEAVPLTICRTNYDYAIGAAWGIANERLSCSYRAAMLEQGITRIQTAIGGFAGITTAVLKDKIKEFLTRPRTPAITESRSSPYSIISSEKTNINPEVTGGRRKSRRGKKKTRKSRKSRKIRSKKY